MDIMIAGALSALGGALYERLRPEHKLVFVAKRNAPRDASAFDVSAEKGGLSRLFRSCDFGAAVFLAARGEQKNDTGSGGLDELDEMLRLCAEHRVPFVIFLSSSEVYGQTAGPPECSALAPTCASGYKLMAAENLCDYYRNMKRLNIVSLRVPYLYGENAEDSWIARAVAQTRRGEKLALPGEEGSPCDFVSCTDTARLVGLLLDQGYTGHSGVVNVGSGVPMTFFELAALLQKSFPNAEISFGSDPLSVPAPPAVQTARTTYDWVALDDFREMLPLLAEKAAAAPEKRETALGRVRAFFRAHPLPFRLFELGLGFLLAEYLGDAVLGSTQLQFVDLRLLFVIMMGSVYGMRLGLAAGLLACAGCIMGYASRVAGWQLVVYNFENWLPFITYLLAGTVTGYIKDKSLNALKFQEQQAEALTERYGFLSDLYEETLENKERYKRQILGYRESFGRIYAAARRLDSLEPDLIYLEAVQILEEMLESDSVAVYTVSSNGAYARLAACSKELAGQARRSVNLAEWSAITEELKEDGVWHNRDLLEGYPALCAPVYLHGRLSALIVLQRAGYEQRSLSGLNLLRVLSGLTQAALARAAGYAAAMGGRSYFSGMRILKNKEFLRALRARQKLADLNVASFTLLRAEHDAGDIARLDRLIGQSLRSTDIAGLGSDGRVYLILPQLGREGRAAVLERLRARSLFCSAAEQADAVAVRQAAGK